MKGFNYKRDRKRSRKGDPETPAQFDNCQTDPRALQPLMPHVPHWIRTIWEPAAGEGLLVRAMQAMKFRVIASDILTGAYSPVGTQAQNFLEWEPAEPWDMIITNGPFSWKFDFLKRCYELGRPFALLVPLEAIGAATARALFKRYGVEVILMDRVNFKMPIKKWEGSGSQFPVCWITWQLGIGQRLVF